MKRYLKIQIILLSLGLFACEKTQIAPQSQPKKAIEENCGPYGKFSTWESIGGDTLFSEKLTLTYFATEENSPCNKYYYQQNFSFWNCYDYTMKVSECIVSVDTLVCIDIDTQKKVIFKREK